MNCTRDEILSALEKFITEMERIQPSLEQAPVEAAIEDICKCLNIAEVECRLIENPHVPRNSAAGGRSYLFRGVGAADRERSFGFTRTTKEGNQAECRAYPVSGAPDWTEEEIQHVNTFITALFAFNSWARIMNIAERLKYRDEDFLMYNGNYFMKTAGQMLAQGGLEGYACCRFNIKNMSVYNRQWGPQTGTRMMKQFVKGLEHLVEDNGFVCRLGGDNFLVLFKNELMQSVKGYLEGTPVAAGKEDAQKIRMGATTGFYVITKNNSSPHDLMMKMSVAYETARGVYGTSSAIYDEQLKQHNDERKWIEGKFDSALDNEEFLVYYQPKVNILDNRLTGAEALCRWKHEGEIIPPMQFIPVLERTANICALDFYVLERVCKDIRRWLDEGMEVVSVSVNFSRLHLGDRELANKIFEIVNRYDVPHEYIEIELTETTTDVDFRELKRIVGQLSNTGFQTAVDDFGMGYSSLNLIRELPWNVLKIDKSFLPLEGDQNYKQKESMLKHVIAMAQDLGIECIVEGTETKEQVELIRRTSCCKAQGFYYDKPLPVEQFEERLKHPIYE